MSTLRNDPIGFRYGKPTQGWNAQGFFSGESPNDVYSVSTTIQSFVYAPNADAGMIGLYAADGTLLPVSALAANTEFIIAQKQSDGDLKKSTMLQEGAFTVEKHEYETPARDIKIVGYAPDTALGSLNINIVGGLQEFVLSARQTNQANQPFPVQEGRAIVRSGTPTDYDIISRVVAQFNTDFDYEKNGDVPFAVSNVLSDQAGAAATIGTDFYFTGNSNQIYVPGVDVTTDPLCVVGNYIIDNPSQIVQKITKVVYDGPDSTITTDYARQVLVSQVGGGNISGVKIVPLANITYATETEMSAALLGAEVVGVDPLTTFDVQVSEDLGDATVVQEAPGWAAGGGAAWQVARTEDECMVFDGWTTVNEAWIRDYGVPDIFVDERSDTTYSQYFIESLNRIIPSAGAPQNQTLMKANVIIAAITGSDLETSLDTIFGV